jgi:hypothetical protein
VYLLIFSWIFLEKLKLKFSGYERCYTSMLNINAAGFSKTPVTSYFASQCHSTQNRSFKRLWITNMALTRRYEVHNTLYRTVLIYVGSQINTTDHTCGNWCHEGHKSPVTHVNIIQQSHGSRFPHTFLQQLPFLCRHCFLHSPPSDFVHVCVCSSNHVKTFANYKYFGLVDKRHKSYR